MHAISSYRGNRPTNTQTHPPTNKQTHIQDRLQYTAPLSLARSVIKTEKVVSGDKTGARTNWRCLSSAADAADDDAAGGHCVTMQATSAGEISRQCTYHHHHHHHIYFSVEH